MEPLWKFILFIIIALIALVSAILSSLMVTEKGTKEHGWWVFLMSVTWSAFGLSTLVAGLCGYTFFKQRRAKMPSNTTVVVNTPESDQSTQPSMVSPATDTT